MEDKGRFLNLGHNSQSTTAAKNNSGGKNNIYEGTRINIKKTFRSFDQETAANMAAYTKRNTSVPT